MNVDRNTDLIPKQGCLYTGKVEPGTPFNYVVGDVNMDGKINMKDLVYLQRYLKAIPHNPCASDAQSDFSSECINLTQAG